MLSRATVFRLVKEPEETQSHMGRATRYYMHIFDHFYKAKQWFQSWNWAAFLAALMGAELVWMIYRRMYRYALFYFMGLMLFSYGVVGLIYFFNHSLSLEVKQFILSKFADQDFLFVTLRILLWLVKMPLVIGFGLWGNALYFKFLAQQSKKTDKPKSGVSTIAAGTVCLLLVATLLFGNLLLQKSSKNLYETAYGKLMS